jgi:hypothetical protein
MKLFFMVVALALMLAIGGGLAAQEISREMVALEVQEHFATPPPSFWFTKDVAGEGELTRLVNMFFNEEFLYVDYLSRESKDYRGGLVDSVCAFLETQGSKITGYSQKPKTPVVVHDVKAIAVRHIFPLRPEAQGKIGILVCASALGFKDYPERNAAVEAFTFQTIFNEMKKGENSLIRAKNKEYGELARNLRLSNNPEDLIKRAQGVYWMLFYQSPDFEKLLLEAYSKEATILPFKIVTD